eukprot:11455573-Ditylum_brightwellii.AAC.1
MEEMFPGLVLSTANRAIRYSIFIKAVPRFLKSICCICWCACAEGKRLVSEDDTNSGGGERQNIVTSASA